jgi:Reverse transcriptase (RNA-dependent DNA polymerase)
LEPDIWTANKYISAPATDGGKTRIPVLKQQAGGQENMASTNHDKSKMLAKVFFPEKPNTNEASAEQHEYPTPVSGTHKITRDQIRRQTKHLKLYKAPSPDGIPNIVLSQCADLLTDRLWYIYSAILERGLYFALWKQFTTVVLRKPGKPRYDTPKAYRPIALLNTMGKLLTVIIAEQLTYYTEKYTLLPPAHFGGRPGRTTTDALHMLIYKIKDAWQKKQVVSVLFLDIEGAFPNAVNERLVHNLRTRKVPDKIVKFISNLLREHSTALKFDNYMSDRIALDKGIGQGDPLSMILYQYYNADLVDIPQGPSEAAAAYIDDAILVATAKDFPSAHEMLADMMTRSGGAIEWSNKHNSRFEFSKLALIDFAHQNNKKQSGARK